MSGIISMCDACLVEDEGVRINDHHADGSPRGRLCSNCKSVVDAIELATNNQVDGCLDYLEAAERAGNSSFA